MTDEPVYERLYDMEGYDEKVILRIFGAEPAGHGEWTYSYWLEAPPLHWKKLRTAPSGDKLYAFAFALAEITVELRYLSRMSGSFLSFMGDRNIDLIDRDCY